MNKYLKRFLQGLLLGFALITGIGGGTTAVLIGVYDDLVNAVSDFRKSPKSSISLLLPMGVGILISIAAFFYPIKLLLTNFPFVTISLFAGLTIGGLRFFSSSLQGNFNYKNLALSLIGFVFVFAVGASSFFSTMQADLLNIDTAQIILLFFVAFIAIGAHVSPGISGTFILIALGYYEELTDFVIRLVRFDFVSVGYDLGALVVFGIGGLLGIVVVAKAYKYFLSKNRVKTNFTIFGFILGSITIAYFNGKIRPLYAKVDSFDPLTLILCIVALVGGALLSSTLLGIVNRKEKAALEAAISEEDSSHVGV